MKIAKCEKCGRDGYVEQHHILPKCDFGEGETIDLCPNCHNEYHRQLGNNNLKGKSIEFHVERFYRWLFGVAGLFVASFLLIRHLI